MNTPTTEEVNALIERLVDIDSTTTRDELVKMLTALRDENARLAKEAQSYCNSFTNARHELERLKAAAPAWVPISERKPAKEDLPYIWFNDQMELRYAPVGTVFIGSGQWSITHWMRIYWRKALAHARKERATP